MGPSDDDLLRAVDEGRQPDGPEDEREGDDVQARNIERSRRFSNPGAESAHHAAREIRGHLAVLSGYLSMLEDGTLGQLPRAARSALLPMRAKAVAISRVVEDLLEEARVQDGRVRRSRTSDAVEVVPPAIEPAAYPTDPVDR